MFFQDKTPMTLRQSVSLTLGMINQYQQPHRAYHNLKHIEFMMSRLEVMEDNDTYPVNVELMTYAIIFHDWFYEVGAKDNELKSAHYASTWLRKFNNPLSEVVGQLILATREHRLVEGKIGPLNLHEALLLDLDMLILATSPEAYKAYANGVRKESLTVYSVADYLRGREHWLVNTLARKKLFNLPIFNGAEEVARRNMEEEITSLREEWRRS
jgi:predicted metal-dependent HD superfamily phosphohydrolase